MWLKSQKKLSVGKGLLHDNVLQVKIEGDRGFMCEWWQGQKLVCDTAAEQ